MKSSLFYELLKVPCIYTMNYLQYHVFTLLMLYTTYVVLELYFFDWFNLLFFVEILLNFKSCYFLIF